MCEFQLARKSSDVSWKSNDLVVNWCEIQMIYVVNDLRLKWFGCQLIWDSSGWDIKCFEIQVIRLSTDVWFWCQLVWGSIDLVVKWIEIQVIWLSTGLGFKRVGDFLFCETSLKNDKNKSFSARYPSKTTCWTDTWLQNYNTWLTIFKSMLQKVMWLPRKSWAEAYELL